MRRLIAVIAALGAVGILAGCGHPYIPSSATSNGHHAAKATHAAPLLGVDVYGETLYTTAKIRQYGSEVLPYLHKTLKAQVVGLMWNMCTANKKANNIAPCASDIALHDGTMSPADVSVLAKMARKDGLQVAMRPIIRVGSALYWNDPKKSWEGYISPGNYEGWFKSLLAAYTPYLKIAKKVHAEQFVAGTELYSLKNSFWWDYFFINAHEICGCQVSYSAQDTEFIDNAQNLPKVSNYGTDLYPALHLPSSASQQSVTTGWEKALAKVPKAKLEVTSLDEISIRATAGAYQHPSNWAAPGPSDSWVQARYYTAACKTAAHYHMQALFFYFVPINDDPAHPINFPAYFIGQGNRGGEAIAACRKILATGAIN